MTTTVLVAYATERGSTAEIAERVAVRIADAGFSSTTRDVERDPRPEAFDAVVLGSAVHGAALLPSALIFVREHEKALRTRPLWLFTVGLQPSAPHQHRAFRRLIASSPPREVPELEATLHPMGYRAFAGVLRAHETRTLQRWMFRLLGGEFGDFRDWPQIDRWADGIAARLATGALTGGGHGG